ncbi:AfsR/SARP family transcriptional regulator [Kocuria sabuli]|uniref:AfsR/SARP family transcriptional regulator n=1 Tax=Kocuria sabuli TaxID=3071448 RepID=UPI0034D3B63C
MTLLETLERHHPRGDGTPSTTPPRTGAWRLQLLGTWALHCDGVAVQVPHRAQRLLTALALLDPRPRSYLAGQLWPDSTEEQAAGNLRNCIWKISHLFPDLLDRQKDPVLLRRDVVVDVHLLTAVFDPAGAFPDPPYTKESIELLGKAELLPGWYDDWLLHDQERTRQLRVRALERMAELSLAAGHAATAVDAALAAAAIEPLRESAHRLLMQGHLAAGNRASAHRVYDRLHCRLGEELGILPSPELKSLIASP